MLENSLFILVCVIIVALIFDYINGVNDAANAIATCVSTRALSVFTAVTMAAVLNFIGAMISTKVAATIGQSIVKEHGITQLMILSGMCGAVIWSTITWYFAIPSSSTHALIGGIIGASIASCGFNVLQLEGIKYVVLSLICSPIIGLILGYFFMIMLSWMVRYSHPSILNKKFKKLQIISAATMAVSHGTADAQKSMGIITMALVSYNYLNSFNVPWLVIISCAISMAIGTAIGGRRIIKTVGKDFVKLLPIHGFCIQTTSTLVVLVTAILGLPTSTTHIITSTILSVGLTKRLSAVNWKIAMNILWAWLFTIPASGIVAFIVYIFLKTLLTIVVTNTYLI